MQARTARWLRVITGLVAANLLGVTFCFMFGALFWFNSQAGVQSKAQQWITALAVIHCCAFDCTPAWLVNQNKAPNIKQNVTPSRFAATRPVITRSHLA